jgi:hypothetical protein
MIAIIRQNPVANSKLIGLKGSVPVNKNKSEKNDSEHIRSTHKKDRKCLWYHILFIIREITAGLCREGTESATAPG